MQREILLVMLGIIFSVSQIAAQKKPIVAAGKSTSTPGIGKFYYANRNLDEPARAIEFEAEAVTPSYFLSNINRYLNISPEFTFIETESNTDKLGMKHRHLRQLYKGILLEGMEYRVHEKNGFVTSANGKAVRNIKLDTKTSISEQQAFYHAVKYLNTKDTVFRQARKLIVSKDFAFTPESFFVAFQFDIDVSIHERWKISIDARNGEVINKVSLVYTCMKDPTRPRPFGKAMGLTDYYGYQEISVEQYEGGGSRMVGQTESGGTIGTYNYGNASFWAWVFDDYNVYDFYSSNSTYMQAYERNAVSVHWGAEQAYEYFFKKHGRDSYDNNGNAITSYVHFDNQYDNAFWSRNRLVFGDGLNGRAPVELDIVSHELTHGVTQYEAQLEYYYEPGALNESFSDIFGKAVEFEVFGDTATWQLARHWRDGGLRDMSNPNLKNQPDTYMGNMWFTGYEDNGGVHYNSGVQNYWFYLLCEGGSGVNDHQMNYSINAIGIDAASDIAYRNLTEYLGYSSDYLDSRIGSLLATGDLYGKGSTIYQEVDKAWDAVGVIDEPIITSLVLFDITATTVKARGTLLPRGDIVTYHFEYGPTPALGTSSEVYDYAGSVEGILTGLQSKTKYYVMLVATNENGSSYYNAEFTTISLAPLVKIKTTVDVTESTATLHAEVNPNSLPTTFYFEYGTTPALGEVTPSYPVPDTTEFLTVSATVIDLLPRQTYYYRLVAVNGFASSSTSSSQFFTAVRPLISAYSPTSGPIDTEVTITGENFNTTADHNLVNFGATRAVVVSSTPTVLKVKVPAGASLGPITIQDAQSGLRAESTREFVPTYTGQFTKGSLQLTMGTYDYMYQTSAQDMDGDNKADLVVRHYLGLSVFLNVNQGGDVTEESFVRSTFNMENTPGSLSLVDFDGNGLKDIVFPYANGLRILPNLSVQGYIFFGTPVDLPATTTLHDIVFNDFDLDGRIDIAGARYMNSDISTLVIIRNQNPRGTIEAQNFEERFALLLSYYASSLYSSDIDNDGKPDLVVAPYNRNFIPILTNNSNPGTFDFEESLHTSPQQSNHPRFLTQDLNDDGWTDLTIFNSLQNGDLSVQENMGLVPDIALEDPAIILSGYEKAIIEPGDLNGDGKVDLMMSIPEGKFILLKNKNEVDARLTSSSFESVGELGIWSESAYQHSSITINDLNGDGRPEVINTYYHNRWPLRGYMMEIWQNAPTHCLDPSGVSAVPSRSSASIILPPNTTMEQFEIEYAPEGWTYWSRVNSPTLDYLYSGQTYDVRVRAKCYLGFTDYHYFSFTTECIDLSHFSVTGTTANSVTVEAYNLGNIEVQYSPAEKNEWLIAPQSTSVISGLIPGTTYDLRFRGRCPKPGEFQYKEFTTLCPNLVSIQISNVTYNKAEVTWTSQYGEDAVLEYSIDQVSWTLIDATRVLFPLLPAQTYFVRGALSCPDLQSGFIYKSFKTPCPQVSVLDINDVTPFSARVVWSDPSVTGSYVLHYSTVGGATKTNTTSSTSFDLHDLTPGTDYTVSVAPVCSGAKVFETIAFRTTCFVPFDLQVNSTSHTTAELSWNDNFGGVTYSIDYSVVGSNVWLTSKTALTQISLSELRPGAEYEVRVHITCINETAQYVSRRFETSLYERTSFFPNPTGREITIQPSKDLIDNRFFILDNVGRVVSEGELREYTIDLSSYPAGVYTLKIEGEPPMRIVKH